MYKKQMQKIRWMILIFVLFIVYILGQQQVKAATHDYAATQVALEKTQVGRYRLNYTGNTNYFDVWLTPGIAQSRNTYNDIGYENSSTAALSAQSSFSTIAKAYLIWEGRASAYENNTTTPTYPIHLITSTGEKHTIYPTYSVSDNRNLGDPRRNYAYYYCMATDVTDIVKRCGFGNYSVYNMKRWEPSWTYQDLVGEYPGGDSVGAWQLVIIEESKEFSVRAVSLSIASEFHLSTDFTGSLTLGDGLKSKTNGSANGQFLFAAVRSGTGDAMTEKITTKNSFGSPVKEVVGNSISSPGLYRNGQLVNGRDYAAGGMCIDLSDVENIGNSVLAVDLAVRNNSWTTFHMLGMSIDIAYPEFVGEQTTTVNSSASVTVTGQFTNTAATSNTGIYNGNLVIHLDSGLTPVSASAVINGTTVMSGAMSGSTVTFRGSEVSSMMNGNAIRYTIVCATGSSGKVSFQNSAGFHGYLRSDGSYTGYWITDMWTAASNAAAKYRVTIKEGTGIESVTGSGDYAYGATVKPTAALKPGYHWSSWTGSHTSTQQDFTFSVPAGNITLTANGEANQYTILFDSNEGEGHMDSITATYDVPFVLPANVFTRRNDYGVSVFRGWNRIPDTFEEFYKDQAELINLTTENNGYITLYAIWDDTPWIIANDLYYTLEQAQSGSITREELMSHATAEDREDGFIMQGDDSGREDIDEGSQDAETGKWTSFIIKDYLESDFTHFQHEGSVTETFQVTDSIGNTYQKTITVYIADTTAVAVKPVGTTRFINENYYYKSYENGGLSENSVWKTDVQYQTKLQRAFENIKNDTPEQSYLFTHEDILKMKEFVKENGIGNSQSEDALSRFYEQFVRSH